MSSIEQVSESKIAKEYELNKTRLYNSKYEYKQKKHMMFYSCV
jgi:hypothetical protein